MFMETSKRTIFPQDKVGHILTDFVYMYVC